MFPIFFHHFTCCADLYGLQAKNCSECKERGVVIVNIVQIILEKRYYFVCGGDACQASSWNHSAGYNITHTALP